MSAAMDRTRLEAEVRCEVILAALPSLGPAIGAADAAERPELERLLKTASASLWELHARFRGGR